MRLSKLVIPTLLVTGGSLWYALSGSIWFNECDAQLDPISLMPKDCRKKSEPEFLPGCEGRLWPAFGSCSKTNEGLSAFWGSDPLSKTFSGMAALAGEVFHPIMQDSFVPAWNNFFMEKERRSAVKGIVLLTTGALATELIREWWILYKKENRIQGRQDDSAE